MSIRPAGRLRIPTWVLLVAVCVEVALAVWSTFGIERDEDSAFRADTILNQIDRAVHDVFSLEAGAFAEPAAMAVDSPDLVQRVAKLKTSVGELAEVEGGDAAAGAILASVDQYLADVEQLYRLVERGEVEAARRWDDERVDVAHRQLLSAIDDVAADLQEAAERVDRTEDRSLAATVSWSVVLVGLLIWQLGRARAQLVVDAEAHERRLGALVANSSDLIFVLDPTGVVLFASSSAVRETGAGPTGLVGRSLWEITHPDDWSDSPGILPIIAGGAGRSMTRELRLLDLQGAWRRYEAIFSDLTEHPAIGGIVVNARDVTEREVLQAELAHQAVHDLLTGLPNRVLFADRLAHSLARHRRRASVVAVLILDLDDFKLVNDALGHAIGDALLSAVADRLKGIVREGDTVARLGGDEFAFLIEDIENPLAIEEVIGRILAKLRQPYPLRRQLVLATASVGVAVSSSSNRDPSLLLRDADTALYAAKRSGKDRFAFFEPNMNTRAVERLRLGSGLRGAIDSDEFRIHYQPLIALRSEHIVAVEALLRWEHPTDGLIGPDQFMTIAEETGLILPIGMWVLEHACRDAQRWFDEGWTTGITLCVNLSPRQFAEPMLVADVARILDATGFPPALLEFEVTESVAMADGDRAKAVMWALRDLGVKLALDDFGTGYSSLSTIREFPITTLKIARPFIEELGRDADGDAIARAVVAIARTMNLSVTAEGVETETQVAVLRELGCDFAQGYYYARPLPEAEVAALLKRVPKPIERKVSAKVDVHAKIRSRSLAETA